MRRGYFFPRRIPVELMRQAEIQSGWMEWEAAVGDTKSTFCGGVSRERSGKMSERNGTTTQWNKVAFYMRWHTDVIISRMCPAPACVAALNNKNVLLQTTNPLPPSVFPLAPHMYCEPWLGGQALTSVCPSRNAVLWALAVEQENGAPAVSSSPKLTQFLFSPPTSRRLSLDFCQKGAGTTLDYIRVWLKDIYLAFSSKRWVFFGGVSLPGCFACPHPFNG